ncbi:MAG: NADH-quinone oxidoreductase subunit L, partial [Proteobacteria bacterium]|nr:NADH-quinone oxidoreductase subunit L [Pseudomonadota bacterium]
YLYVRNKALPARLAGANDTLYRFLLNKWYFDEIYDRLIVRPVMWLGTTLWRRGDGRIIDGFGPDGFAAVVIDLARRAGSAQTGYLYHYAFVMLASVAGLVTWLLLSGAG